jgi:hypothetical protein
LQIKKGKKTFADCHLGSWQMKRAPSSDDGASSICRLPSRGRWQR